ncbi:hypothetical protein AVEN_52569-1 [Araneus ventricosus]|uniref:ATP-dependent DNA helicase n=1 Tax=Araneus ventricosus TaxID=182803 RepID=A0A4Y2NSY3_ARAVE|nr:hypothetical protein AVEN_52569-1 [Araneus ventricosus]
MYVVNVKDAERFYLHMLLLHVPGATSFKFLRTVDNVIYDTLKQAAFHRHLLNSDEEWDHCLHNASAYQMPKQLRQTFAFILYFCNPTHVLELWNKYWIDMTLDYLSNNIEAASWNLAQHDINATLEQHRSSCASIGLPVPTGNAIEVQPYNQDNEREEAEQRIPSLNREQLAAFETITRAIGNNNENDRYSFLDDPDGSGKTFLYSTLLSFIRGKGDIALPFATTGIAATLLKGGRTVHSGFKLPVPLLDTSVSSMRPTSPEADKLRQAVLIIIDEITMLTKEGLRCIDSLLRDLMNNDKPFGGKVIIIGGDFRQTLPIVPRGERADVNESCIKSSPLWSKFTHNKYSLRWTNGAQHVAIEHRIRQSS